MQRIPRAQRMEWQNPPAKRRLWSGLSRKRMCSPYEVNRRMTIIFCFIVLGTPMLFKCSCIKSFISCSHHKTPPPQKTDTNTPILQLKTLKLRDGKWLVHIYTPWPKFFSDSVPLEKDCIDMEMWSVGTPWTCFRNTDPRVTLQESSSLLGCGHWWPGQRNEWGRECTMGGWGWDGKRCREDWGSSVSPYIKVWWVSSLLAEWCAFKTVAHMDLTGNFSSAYY